MPKNKKYEFDYEWSGDSAPQKGVNPLEQTPWKKPTFAATKPSSNSKCQSSTPVQQPANWNKLQAVHPWQKPNWATVDKSPKKKHNAIMKDSIPLPMLKGVGVGGVGGGSSSGSNGAARGRGSPEDDEIAAMERRIAAAKARKAALEKEKEAAVTEAEAERQRHTVDETKVERARRLAKEREEARWRATLQERNERDKAKRESARIAGATTTAIHADAAWQKPKPSAVRSGTNPPTRKEPAITTQSPVGQPQPPMITTPQYPEEPAYVQQEPSREEEYEAEEEYTEEEYTEEAEEVVLPAETGQGTEPPPAELDAEAAELQRQIDELQRQLQLGN